MPKVDALIKAIWEDHVHAAAQICGVVGPNDDWDESNVVPLDCDWGELRSAIASGMALTSHSRFIVWCGGEPVVIARKRKEREGDKGSDPASEIGGDRFKLKKGRFKLMSQLLKLKGTFA